jgi:hypothetical protein
LASNWSESPRHDAHHRQRFQPLKKTSAKSGQASGSLAKNEAIVDRPLGLIEPRFAIHGHAPEWLRASQMTH